MLPAEHQLSGRSIGERCGNEKPQRVPFGEDILGTGVQGKAGFYGFAHCGQQAAPVGSPLPEKSALHNTTMLATGIA